MCAAGVGGGVESVKEGGDKEKVRTVMYVGHTACFFCTKKSWTRQRETKIKYKNKMEVLLRGVRERKKINESDKEILKKG